MNMPLSGSPTPEVVTQESLLLGATERIGRIREGRTAVILHLSRLKPQNRQEGHIRIALRMLEPMVNAYRGQMFLLSTSDIVFLLKDPNPLDVENMIYKLRALFSKDPLTYIDTGDGKDHFCSWFDLGGQDYFEFQETVRDADEKARQRMRDKASQGPVERPLESKQLGEILERLASANLSRIVRRQAAIVINGPISEVLFQEYFVSIAELQKILAPDINIFANRWLFQHLSQTLDERVIRAVTDMRLRSRPAITALNLNISTVLSPVFETFAETIAPLKLSAELQVLDVLADSRGYYEARRRLRAAGHMVTIDGLNELTLQFMDMRLFDADLYKITWGPEMGDPDRAGAIGGMLSRLDNGRILIARCDSEAAITWGMERGIERFQGRYVDAMLAAFTMSQCNKAAACTLAQCINRHTVIEGPLRAECGNNDMLDSSPLMTRPAGRKKQEAGR